MNQLFEYIMAHEGEAVDCASSGPVIFESILEELNRIDWRGVDEYIDKRLKEEPNV